MQIENKQETSLNVFMMVLNSPIVALGSSLNAFKLPNKKKKPDNKNLDFLIGTSTAPLPNLEGGFGLQAGLPCMLCHYTEVFQ